MQLSLVSLAVSRATGNGDNSISFFAPLRTSLVPSRGTGSATYTRATTATVFGFAADAVSGAAQVLLTCASGEARFQGARRVSEGVWSDVLADGTPIPAATLLNYLAEGARTNSLLWGRDFTNAAWVKTTMTAAKTASGIDGAAAVASTLTASSANATALQTIVLAAAARSFGLYVKRRTGTGTVEITRDGLSWTNVTSQINASTYTRVKIENTSVLNPILGVRLVTSGDEIDVDYGQDEAGAFLSSPILTTSAAVTRNADMLTYPSAGNISNTAGTLFVETNTVAPISARNAFILRVLGAVGMDHFFNFGKIRITDGTNQADITGISNAIAALSLRSAVSYVTGSIMRVSAGGAATTSVAACLLSGPTSISIGVDLYGTIGNVRLYNRAFSNAELQALTS